VQVKRLTLLTEEGRKGGERWERGSQKRRRGKEGVERERGQGPLAREGGLYLNISAGVPEFLVTPLLTRPT